jgi:hypothetical protein
MLSARLGYPSLGSWVLCGLGTELLGSQYPFHQWERAANGYRTVFPIWKSTSMTFVSSDRCVPISHLCRKALLRSVSQQTIARVFRPKSFSRGGTLSVGCTGH